MLPLKKASYICRSLFEDGYVIIPNIISEKDMIKARNMFDEWQSSVENLADIHRKIDPHGIYKHHQAGHQRHAWFLRTHPDVQKIFKFLLNTDELIVSYDGCCYIPKDEKKKDNCWTHTDQGPKLKGLTCYQGFISFTENKERTLLLYKGSHKLHEKYFSDRGLNGSKNWCLIDKDYLSEIDHMKIKLHVPNGALVIWDSRVFHQNTYGSPNSEERLVQYISFMDRNNAKNNESNRNKRKRYFEEKRMTSHWCAPVNVNSLQPQVYGDSSLLIDYDSLPKIELDDMMNEIIKLI